MEIYEVCINILYEHRECQPLSNFFFYLSESILNKIINFVTSLKIAVLKI